MTWQSKWLGALALCGVAMIVTAGCADRKKDAVGGNATTPAAEEADGEAKEDAKAEPAKEEPKEEAEPKDMPKEEPAAAPPAPDAPADAPAEKPADNDAAAAEQVAEAKTSGKILLGSDDLFAGISGEGPLTEEQIKAWLAEDKNHEPLDFELPLGLAKGATQIKGVDQNPLTRAKIELGRQLYFDPRLSADMSVACASCHDPEEGFAKHTRFGVGIKGQEGGRNSPVSYNRILSDKQFWDGRADSLEAQAVGPIANPIEMGNTHDACIQCLAAIPGYKQQFDKIFGALNIDSVGAALASFERAVVTDPAPFDYYEALKPFEDLDPEDIEADPELKKRYEEAKAGAEAHPMTESAKRGYALFFSEKAGCSACHVGANLSDEKYHNLGVGMDKEQPDVGRHEFSKDEKERGAFKTPTIRNVAKSAPYMHDGSQKTLEEVVEWYAKGGHPNPHLSEKIKKLDLTDQDKKDLVEFMVQGCTSDFPTINRGRLPE